MLENAEYHLAYFDEGVNMHVGHKGNLSALERRGAVAMDCGPVVWLVVLTRKLEGMPISAFSTLGRVLRLSSLSTVNASIMVACK